MSNHLKFILNKLVLLSSDDHTCALVFPIDVLKVESFVALADVATKRVDAFSEPGTHRYSCCTLIDICKKQQKRDIASSK